MFASLLRWLGRNLGTLLLAFLLAVVVWVSAVVTADPNQNSIYPKPITLDVKGQDAGLVLVGDVPETVRVTIDAPKSVWDQLNNNPGLVEAWIDLTGLGAGPHTVKVNVSVRANPVRSSVEPQTVQFSLEPLISKKVPVQVKVNGDPPLGYRKGSPIIQPAEVTVSGASSKVDQVSSVSASMDISGARETRQTNLTVQANNESDVLVEGVTINPKVVSVTLPINLEGGYKNVVVKVVTTGQIANGYRLTNISVTPPNVTVFSTNPQLVNQMPGYVETQPVDLTGLSDDIEVRKTLNLPSQVELVGEQSVLVQVSVAAIEGSLKITIPIETLGLPPNLEARISPATVDVIVAGPLPVLDTLTSASFRVVVDLTGLTLGGYQIAPKVDLVPDQVQVQTILPDSVEVTIIPASTPTLAPPTIATPGPLLSRKAASPPARH